ncbi:GPW/gp25 family protein [Pseudomonas sp. HK3]
MRGMNNTTGKPIEGIAYLQQRLRDVLTTPKGSRIMRPEYGCGLFQRIDENITPAWVVLCFSDIAEAIDNSANGLSDFILEQIKVAQQNSMNEDNMIFDLIGIYKPTGQSITLGVSI